MGEDLSESFKLSPMWFKALVCKSNPALCKALPKTPYELDLEVKDRKPSIVPKVGDKVKIKSREWYEKWKDGSNYVNVSEFFVPQMADFCGKVLTVEGFQIGGFKMKEDEHKWVFSTEMFEEVYPVQEQLSSEFPKIDLNNTYLYQSPYEVKGSELVLSKEELERLKVQFLSTCPEREKELLKKQPFFASKVEEFAKRLTAYTLIQGLDDKPKLKQVKTTHLIKLKKL